MNLEENWKDIKGRLIEEGLFPVEAERVVNIWQKEEEGEAEFIPAEEAWEKLGVEK